MYRYLTARHTTDNFSHHTKVSHGWVKPAISQLNSRLTTTAPGGLTWPCKQVQDVSNAIQQHRRPPRDL